MNILTHKYSILIYLSIIYAMSITSSRADSDKISYKAPIRCEGDLPAASCGTSASLNEVEASAEKLIHDVVICGADPTQCSALQISQRLADPSFACNGAYLNDDEWLPSSINEIEAKYGNKIEAKDGKRRSRVSASRQILIEASDSPLNERHFALCSVSTIDARSGPPKDCVTVAVEVAGKIYRRTSGRDGISSRDSNVSCIVLASYSLSGGIHIDYRIHTDKKVSDVADAVQNLLTSYFELAVNRTSNPNTTNYIGIESTSGLRDSKIIPSWREAFDLSVSIEQEAQRVIRLTASTNPLICKTASSKIFEYRGLDDGQRNAYATAFNSRIKEAIVSACGKIKSSDNNTIFCQ